jgi:hypothetical protein
MDTMVRGWFSQKTYCSRRGGVYYASLSKRNFRACSDAHTNFFKDVKDLERDLKNKFRGNYMYYALMDASQMMRDVKIAERTCRPDMYINRHGYNDDLEAPKPDTVYSQAYLD